MRRRFPTRVPAALPERTEMTVRSIRFLQLANVTRPRISHQRIHRRRRNELDRVHARAHSWAKCVTTVECPWSVTQRWQSGSNSRCGGARASRSFPVPVSTTDEHGRIGRGHRFELRHHVPERRAPSDIPLAARVFRNGISRRTGPFEFGSLEPVLAQRGLPQVPSGPYDRPRFGIQVTSCKQSVNDHPNV